MERYRSGLCQGLAFAALLLQGCLDSLSISSVTRLSETVSEEEFLSHYKQALLDPNINRLGDPSEGDLGFFGVENLPLYPRVRVGGFTMGVWQSSRTGKGIIVFRDGRIERTPPSINPLAKAIRFSEKGDVIALAGVFRGIILGSKHTERPQYAYWGSDGSVPIDGLSLVSLRSDRPATIGGINIEGDIFDNGYDPNPNDGNTLIKGGGVKDILFGNVIITNAHDDARTPFLITRGTHHGAIRLYEVTIQSSRPNSYYGYGMKWAMRWQGRVNTVDVRGLNCPRALEHCFYFDSPGYLDDEQSYTILDRVVQEGDTGRTGVQIVNRRVDEGGRSGHGPVVIHASQFQTEHGQGGSAITVAGHLGEVYILNTEIETDLGAIVVYPDAPKGLHLNEAGYSCPLVYIDGLKVEARQSSGIREQIILSGVETVEVHQFEIATVFPRASFDFRRNGNTDNPIESDGFGSRPYFRSNGTIRFHTPGLLSHYRGFISGRKIHWGNRVLSDGEIDELWSGGGN